MKRRVSDTVRHPVVAGVLSSVVFAILVVGFGWFTGSALGLFNSSDEESTLSASWGPKRTVYRCANRGPCDGADHVTFNSMIDTSVYGDERSFVDARIPSPGSDPPFQNELDVQVGDEVSIRALVDNNANPIRARIAGNEHSARDTTVRFLVPDQSASAILVEGSISASNAEPEQVSDSVLIQAPQEVKLEPIPDSAVLVNSAFSGEGLALDDAILSDGVSIGFRKREGSFGLLDGVYPACEPIRPGCSPALSVVYLKLRVTNPTEE